MLKTYDKFRHCNKLEFNSRKLNCVFMSFYSYIHVDNKHTNKKEKIPVALMQMRFDGAIGFPGGKVETKDYNGIFNEFGLKRALLRELNEEINLDIDIDLNKMEHLSTFASNNLYVHNFSYFLTEEQFMQVYSHSNDNLDVSENAGCIVCFLANFGHGRGFRNFQRNNFKTTSLAELRLLKEKLNPVLI